MNNLFGYFTNKNYSPQILTETFNRALKCNQTRKKHTPMTMVITYNPRKPTYAPLIYPTWKHHWKILPGYLQRPIVCYKRPKNLRDMLVHAAFSEDNIIKLNHQKSVPLKN